MNYISLTPVLMDMRKQQPQLPCWFAEQISKALKTLTYQSSVSNKTCCVVSLLAAGGRLLFWLAVVLKLGQTIPEEQAQLYMDSSQVDRSVLI